MTRRIRGKCRLRSAAADPVSAASGRSAASATIPGVPAAASARSSRSRCTSSWSTPAATSPRGAGCFPTTGGRPGDADLAAQDCTQLPRSAIIVWLGGGPALLIGTSSSSPEMAGVLALAVELNRGRLGNVNPLIYALSAVRPLQAAPGRPRRCSSSIAIFPATTMASPSSRGRPTAKCWATARSM